MSAQPDVTALMLTIGEPTFERARQSVLRQTHPVSDIVVEGATTVTVNGQPHAITHDWQFGGIRAHGSCNGRPFTAQAERHGLWLKSPCTAGDNSSGLNR